MPGRDGGHGGKTYDAAKAKAACEKGHISWKDEPQPVTAWAFELPHEESRQHVRCRMHGVACKARRRTRDERMTFHRKEPRSTMDLPGPGHANAHAHHGTHHFDGENPAFR